MSDVRYKEALRCGNYSLLKLTDAKLKTDDDFIFPVHRVLLARSSYYFLEMFCDDTKNEVLMNDSSGAVIYDDTTSEIKIKNITGDSLCNILIYMYKGKIDVTESNVEEIFAAAHRFKLNELVKKLTKSLKSYLTTDKCLSLYSCVKNTYPGIAEIFLQFIVAHFEELVLYHSSQLSGLSLNSLSSFIYSKNLHIRGEITVWIAIQEWVRKDNFSRQKYVPYLINHLAREELNFNLATEILDHEIVKDNPFCKDLNQLKSTDNALNNLDMLKWFLANNSHYSINFKHRIPAMHLIARYNITGSDGRLEIFITYDDKWMLWRKITEVNCEIRIAFISIDYNLYFCNHVEKICLKFDVKEKQLVSIKTCVQYTDIFIQKVGGVLYLLGTDGDSNEKRTYFLEVYYPKTDTWSDDVPLENIKGEVHPATIDNILYVLEHNCEEMNMIAHSFDTETHTWLSVATSVIFHKRVMLLANSGLLYILGMGEDDKPVVQSYEPKNNKWTTLPNLPMHFSRPQAIILKDQLYVYEHQIDENSVRWIETEKCWKGAGSLSEPEDSLLFYSGSTLLDGIDVNRFMWAENRKPGIKFEKCPLFETVEIAICNLSLGEY